MVKSKARSVSLTDKLNMKCIIFAIIAIVVTFVLYKPSENYEYLNFDDNKLIFDNPVVISGKDAVLSDIYNFQKYMAHYKPLTVFTWNREYEKFRDNPAPYHKHNNYLHILNVLLVFLIIRKLGVRFFSNKEFVDWAAFLVAVVFGAHPMRIESVAWITERKDVLFSFFFLAATLSYIIYAEKKYKTWIIIFPLVFYFLGIHAKSPAITFLGIPFLIDYCYNRKFGLFQILDKLPFIAVIIYAFYVYGFFVNFEHQISGLSEGVASQVSYTEHVNSIANLNPFYRRLLLINFKFWFWVVHNLVPFKLSIVYPRDLILQKTGVFIHFIPLLSLGLGGMIYRFRKNKLFIFSVFLYIITISPALAISDRGTGIFVSDRYSYLSSIGIFSVIFYPLTEKYGKKSYFLGVIPFIYLLLAMNYLPKWRTSETLFKDVVEKYPNQIPVAYNNLGLYYKDKNMPDLAIEYYEKVLSISPEYENARVNLANIYFNSGKFRKAIPYFNLVVEKNPRAYQAFSNRGACFFSLGKKDSALLDFNKAIELNKNYIDAIANRALVYMDFGNLDSALLDLNKLEELVPRNYEYINARGVVYQKKGMHERAIGDFDKALELNDNMAKAYSNRSLSYYYLKDIEKAKEDISKARDLGMQINPKYLEILGLE
jgi:tetratricopeptide (TPR) repeat protein